MDESMNETKPDGAASAVERRVGPLAWIRLRSDGLYEGPIADCDSRIDDLRKASGAWTPLHDIAALRALIADDSYAMTFQSMGQYRSALLKAMTPN